MEDFGRCLSKLSALCFNRVVGVAVELQQTNCRKKDKGTEPSLRVAAPIGITELTEVPGDKRQDVVAPRTPTNSRSTIAPGTPVLCPVSARVFASSRGGDSDWEGPLHSYENARKESSMLEEEDLGPNLMDEMDCPPEPDMFSCNVLVKFIVENSTRTVARYLHQVIHIKKQEGKESVPLLPILERKTRAQNARFFFEILKLQRWKQRLRAADGPGKKYKDRQEPLGSLLGSLEVVNAREDGGMYSRMKVEINLSLPLCPGTKIKTKDCLDKWIDSKYERIPSFCACCGRLGHDIMGCESVDMQDNTFTSLAKGGSEVDKPHVYGVQEETIGQTQDEKNGHPLIETPIEVLSGVALSQITCILREGPNLPCLTGKENIDEFCYGDSDSTKRKFIKVKLASLKAVEEDDVFLWTNDAADAHRGVLFCVYGGSDNTSYDECWDPVNACASRCSLPWLLMGDVNEIIEFADKEGELDLIYFVAEKIFGRSEGDIPAEKGSFLLTRFKDIIYAFRMEHPFALKSNNDTAETLIRWEAPPAGGAQSGTPWLEDGKDFGVEEDLAPSGFNDCGWHAPGQWVLEPHSQAAYHTMQKLNGANRLGNQGDALLHGGKTGSGQIDKFRYYE
ncbi:hypothetical protein Cgig2_004653 [Carnegiea gigantea]|uniref:Zinc knuckle CX2CX4HX4C domain-containing protein n=1 Tax=Carnegiea gigantea TaxID=171969 RepID=A0A9Q1K032_9CARY|nr:hypothetical protein Cgig2_004653 [Carnegiea gigantea]